MTTDEPEIDMMSCPRCGALEPDFDGFGMIAHTKPAYSNGCGFCTHPTDAHRRCLHDVRGARPFSRGAKLMSLQIAEIKEMADLIEAAKKLGPMTEEQRREQAASFAFGNLALTRQWQEASYEQLVELRQLCRRMAGCAPAPQGNDGEKR